MTVTVSLFGEYRKYARASEVAMDLPDGSSVLGVVERLGIPVTPSLWALGEGRRASLDQVVREGSAVSLFQPVGGG